MINSIDQSTDYSHKELYSYLSGVNLPDFVKQAELEDGSDLQGLPKTAFAAKYHGLFPINTPARVYVSNAFFTNKKAALERHWNKSYVADIESNIKKAAVVFGIDKDIEIYNKIAQERLEKTSSLKEITAKLAEHEITLFSFRNKQELVKAANEFVKNIKNYPFEWRRNICTDFVKAAEDYSVDELPDLVCKYAGLFFPDVVHIKDELYRRATKLASADHILIYGEMAQDVKNICSTEEIFKIAEVCQHIEEKEGLTEKVKIAKVLGDPVDRLFTLDFEKVAAIMDVVKVGNEMFSRKDLESVPSDIYSQAFGFELDPKCADSHDILSTMPRSDVELFKELSGIKPI